MDVSGGFRGRLWSLSRSGSELTCRLGQLVWAAFLLMRGAAQGGTGRRLHARPEAPLPSAQPAALTQYRNSSPLQLLQPLLRVEQVTGIGPAPSAWELTVSRVSRQDG